MAVASAVGSPDLCFYAAPSPSAAFSGTHDAVALDTVAWGAQGPEVAVVDAAPVDARDDAAGSMFPSPNRT